MQRTLLIFFISLSFHFVKGQKHKPDHLSFAVTTLHTAFPFGSFSELVREDLHPGFEIGTGFNWKKKTKHDWFQSLQLGYSYHRFVQHSLALYSEIGYRYKFLKSFSAESKFGLGYLHVIPTQKIFKLGDDGNYKKKTNLGRPQAMAAFSLRLNKLITKNGMVVFLTYQQRVQFPFIKSYVPLLPSNMLMAGIQIPYKSKAIQK